MEKVLWVLVNVMDFVGEVEQVELLGSEFGIKWVTSINSLRDSVVVLCLYFHLLFIYFSFLKKDPFRDIKIPSIACKCTFSSL